MSVVKFVIPDFPNNFSFNDEWPEKQKRVLIEADKNEADTYRVYVVVDLKDGAFNGLIFDEFREQWMNRGNDIIFKSVMTSTGKIEHRSNRWISTGRLASPYDLESLRIDAIEVAKSTADVVAPVSVLLPIEVRTVEKHFFLGKEYPTEMDAKRARATHMLKDTFKSETIVTILRYRHIVEKALRSME